MWMGALTVVGGWPKALHVLGTQLQTRVLDPWNKTQGFPYWNSGPLQISAAKLMPRIEGKGWVSLLFALCLSHIG